jgi:hypothetical protein
MLRLEFDKAAVIEHTLRYTKNAWSLLQKTLKSEARFLADYAKKQFFSAKYPNSSTMMVAARTGALRRSIQPTEVTKSAQVISVGITIDKYYAKTHLINNKRPNWKNGIYESNRTGGKLAVPLSNSPAMTAGGKYRGTRGAMGESYVRTDFPEAKIIPIMGKGGVYTGKAYIGKQIDKKTFIPYFVLKKTVKVPKRVDPELILANNQVRLREAMNNALRQANK